MQSRHMDSNISKSCQCSCSVWHMVLNQTVSNLLGRRQDQGLPQEPLRATATGRKLVWPGHVTWQDAFSSLPSGYLGGGRQRNLQKSWQANVKKWTGHSSQDFVIVAHQGDCHWVCPPAALGKNRHRMSVGWHQTRDKWMNNPWISLSLLPSSVSQSEA